MEEGGALSADTPDFLRAWRPEERDAEDETGWRSPEEQLTRIDEPPASGPVERAEVFESVRSGNGSHAAPDSEPPETIPGEESLSPEMARFLRSRRRDKKDSPFRGFESPPGRF
jgi:hypothetical protein